MSRLSKALELLRKKCTPNGVAPAGNNVDEILECMAHHFTGGGGASVQGDWSQNDPTAPDYVKNRTHYAGVGQEILPEMTVTTAEDEGGNYSWYTEESGFNVDPTKTYKVVYNGKEYLCKFDSFNDELGNPYFVYEGNEILGEPFCIESQGGDNKWFWIGTPEPMTFTISISKEEVKTLDRQYMPACYVPTAIINDPFGTPYCPNMTFEEAVSVLKNGPLNVILYQQLDDSCNAYIAHTFFFFVDRPYIQIVVEGQQVAWFWEVGGITRMDNRPY